MKRYFIFQCWDKLCFNLDKICLLFHLFLISFIFHQHFIIQNTLQTFFPCCSISYYIYKMLVEKILKQCLNYCINVILELIKSNLSSISTCRPDILIVVFVWARTNSLVQQVISFHWNGISCFYSAACLFFSA